MPSTQENIIRAMFEVVVTVQVGNDTRALFWRDRWIDGTYVEL
jgi:hypothetical protein